MLNRPRFYGGPPQQQVNPNEDPYANPDMPSQRFLGAVPNPESSVVPQQSGEAQAPPANVMSPQIGYGASIIRDYMSKYFRSPEEYQAALQSANQKLGQRQR